MDPHTPIPLDAELRAPKQNISKKKVWKTHTAANHAFMTILFLNMIDVFVHHQQWLIQNFIFTQMLKTLTVGTLVKKYAYSQFTYDFLTSLFVVYNSRNYRHFSRLL